MSTPLQWQPGVWTNFHQHSTLTNQHTDLIIIKWIIKMFEMPFWASMYHSLHFDQDRPFHSVPGEHAYTSCTTHASHSLKILSRYLFCKCCWQMWQCHNISHCTNHCLYKKKDKEHSVVCFKSVKSRVGTRTIDQVPRILSLHQVDSGLPFRHEKITCLVLLQSPWLCPPPSPSPVQLLFCPSFTTWHAAVT